MTFAGKRNNFTDEENAGKLRVGAAWGVPGIYSEQGPIVVGSQNGNIWLNGKVGIGADKKAPSQNLDVGGAIAAQTLAITDAATVGKLTSAGPIEIKGGNKLAFGVAPSRRPDMAGAREQRQDALARGLARKPKRSRRGVWRAGLSWPHRAIDRTRAARHETRCAGSSTVV
jgi:hypothetical protein